MALTDKQLEQAAQARQKVGDMLTEANKKVDALKAKKKELDDILLGELNDSVPKKTTKYGTLAAKETSRYSVEHQATFDKYVRENDDFSMYTKAVRKEGVEAYIDSNDGELPPGVSVYKQVSLSFTQPRKAAPKR